MRGFETKRTCVCGCLLIWFETDKSEKTTSAQEPYLLPLFCPKCREKYLVPPAEKAKDMFTGWFKNYERHPRQGLSIVK